MRISDWSSDVCSSDLPGISAANGAAAAAQIALTHREASSIVSFVAGQCQGLSEQNWAGLAGKGRTLVIYMGVATAPLIADKLMADGLATEMPIAVIENATRDRKNTRLNSSH